MRTERPCLGSVPSRSGALNIPRLREISKKPLARAGMRDSSGSYDSRRLSDLRGRAGPAGSGRDGRASSGPASERPGAAGPRDELRGGVLLIDDDTIRTWHRLFEEDGVDGLAGLRGSRLP